MTRLHLTFVRKSDRKDCPPTSVLCDTLLGLSTAVHFLKNVILTAVAVVLASDICPLYLIPFLCMCPYMYCAFV